MLDQFQHLAQAIGGGSFIWPVAEVAELTIAFSREQARPDFVMKLERDVAALVVLHRDEPAAQAAIFPLQSVQRLGERIEARRGRANSYACGGGSLTS